MNKHAYLIMAHNDWSLLSRLLRCLDDKRNSIFIHIDKKSKFDISFLYEPEYAECFFVERRTASWGGYSLVAVELELLSEAMLKGDFDFYHLLSGQDLPLKSQDFIHSFFDKHVGKNFILFDPNAEKNCLIENRIQQYHFFQDAIGRKTGPWIALLERIESFSLYVQRKLKVDRISHCPAKIFKGRQWFSISREMADYVLSRKKDIHRWFRYSLCADEMFLQTIAMDSPLRETIMDNSLREIDWIRGKPYTYRKEDYEMLVNSSNLFARKFSTEVDDTIIDLLCNKALSE